MPQQLSVQFPQAMRRTIATLAERQFTSEAAVVRQLVSRSLGLEAPFAEDQSTQKNESRPHQEAGQ